MSDDSINSQSERWYIIVSVALLILVLSSGFLSSNSNVSSAQSVQVGVEPGDWIEYELNWTDPPGDPYSVWIRREILGVNGSIITVEFVQEMSDGSLKSRNETGDVVQGTGAAALVFIPPNLQVGDLVNIEGFGLISIDGVDQKTYLDEEHIVLFSDFQEMGFDVLVYWDRETGVALEIHTDAWNRSGITEIVGSNLWDSGSSNGGNDSNNFLWLGALLFVIVLISIVYFLRRRHTSSKRRKKK